MSGTALSGLYGRCNNFWGAVVHETTETGWGGRVLWYMVEILLARASFHGMMLDSATGEDGHRKCMPLHYICWFNINNEYFFPAWVEGVLSDVANSGQNAVSNTHKAWISYKLAVLVQELPMLLAINAIHGVQGLGKGDSFISYTVATGLKCPSLSYFALKKV